MQRSKIRKDLFAWNAMLKKGAMICLLVMVSGCAMFQADPAPAAPPSATDAEAAEEPVPTGAEANPSPGEAEDVEPLRFESIGIGFLEPPKQEAEKERARPEESIEAKGYGFPSSTASNDIQKRVTATEAAQYRAMANLAEMHSGLDVTREAQTVNMAFAGEEVRVTLSGRLKGVSEVAREYDAESEIAMVTLKMSLDPPDRHEKSSQQLTEEQRKAQAETAARIHATALLREQIGQSYVEQEIHVEGIAMTHQEARIHVEGLLTGIRFSEVLWTSDRICEVTATLEVDKEKLAGMEPGEAGPEDASAAKTP
jgi:hypothetical protein